MWVIKRVYSWSNVLEREKWSWDQLKDQNYLRRASKGQIFAMEHILESVYLCLWAWYKLVTLLPRYFCQFSATFWPQNTQNTLYIPKMESEGLPLFVLGMKGRFGLREICEKAVTVTGEHPLPLAGPWPQARAAPGPTSQGACFHLGLNHPTARGYVHFNWRLKKPARCNSPSRRPLEGSGMPYFNHTGFQKTQNFRHYGRWEQRKIFLERKYVPSSLAPQ